MEKALTFRSIRLIYKIFYHKTDSHLRTISRQYKIFIKFRVNRTDRRENISKYEIKLERDAVTSAYLKRYTRCIRFNIFFLLKKKSRVYGFAGGGKRYFVKKQVRNWCQPSVNISSSSLQDNTMCK